MNFFGKGVVRIKNSLLLYSQPVKIFTVFLSREAWALSGTLYFFDKKHQNLKIVFSLSN